MFLLMDTIEKFNRVVICLFFFFLQWRCELTLFNIMEWCVSVFIGRDCPEVPQIGVFLEKVESLFQQFLREMCRKPSTIMLGMHSLLK